MVSPLLNNSPILLLDYYVYCILISSNSCIGLSKSDVIGDVGSRSFYLRKCSSDSRADNISTLTKNAENGSKNSNYDLVVSPSFAGLIDKKIKKIIMKTRKLWKFLGCMQCIR